MKREIKFRAIKDDMSNPNFVYGFLAYSTDGIPRISDDGGNTFHTCLKGTEGEYTGLKDKNGKEIYEDDIIEMVRLKDDKKYFTGKVTNYGFTGYSIDTSGDYMDFGCKQYSYEVIGNIYENPELAK